MENGNPSSDTKTVEKTGSVALSFFRLHQCHQIWQSLFKVRAVGIVIFFFQSQMNGFSDKLTGCFHSFLKSLSIDKTSCKYRSPHIACAMETLWFQICLITGIFLVIKKCIQNMMNATFLDV